VHGERMIKRSFAPGFPYRLAPEGLEPGPGRCPRLGCVAAANSGCCTTDAGLRRQRHERPGPQRFGEGAGDASEPPGATGLTHAGRP